MTAEALGLLIVACIGLPSACLRPTVWPLVANYALLTTLYYGFGLLYSRGVYVAIDVATFVAIIAIMRPWSKKTDWRDLAVLVLFIPSELVLTFAPSRDASYWTLWFIGVAQYIIAAPWKQWLVMLERRAGDEVWSG